MTTGEIVSLIALGVSLLVMVLAARRDTRGNAAEMASTRATLDSIKTGVDDIRIEQRANRERVDDLSGRMVAVEGSCKSIHKRMDEHLRNEHSERRE